MAGPARHGIAKYNAGCRCDVCKRATSEYHRARRRRLAEGVGDPSVPVGAGLRVINGSAEGGATSENAAPGAVEEAVAAEIEGLGSSREGLKATAVALARILDNPKAVSTQPAAAAKLTDILETLRKSSDGRKSNLARVRSMTKPQVKTG